MRRNSLTSRYFGKSFKRRSDGGRNRPRCSHAVVTAAVECLESRRLFSGLHLQGTANNDDFQLSYISQAGLVTYTAYVNGVGTNYTTNQGLNIIEFDGLGGNDHFKIHNVSFEDSVFIRGGTGDDSLDISEGNFGDDIDGDIYDLESPGEGNDTFTVQDTAGGTNFHDTIHFEATSLYADETLVNDATVHFDENVESKVFNCNNSANSFYIDQPVAGATLNMHDGANTVLYNYGAAAALPADLAAMTLNGGANTDSVVFDDRQTIMHHPAATYTITSTAALNQTLNNFENIEIIEHRPLAGETNHVNINGNPLNSFGFIALDYGSLPPDGGNDITIGSAGAVDFDAMGLHLGIQYSTSVAVNDQDADASNNPWNIVTDYSPARQFIRKGGSYIAAGYGNSGTIEVNGGSTNDTFAISGVTPGFDLGLNGGGGNDICLTSNYFAGNTIPNTQFGDLDAMFGGGQRVTFRGGAGDDQLLLDDSTNQNSDATPNYFLGFVGELQNSYVEKTSNPGDNLQPSLIDFDYTTDRINLAADSRSNVVTFAPIHGERITIDAGGGNDIFQNASHSLVNLQGTITAVGGAGVDGVSVDDTQSSVAAAYTFGVNTFNNGVDRLSINSDSTLENFFVDETPFIDSTRIDGKAAALNLTVHGQANDDSFIVGGGDLDSNGLSHVTLTGGTGVDNIEFDDHGDFFSNSESETYTLGAQELDKGPVAITFLTFESQTLDASTTGSNILSLGETVDLTAAAIRTTIVGGFNRSCVINVGVSDLAPINAIVTLNMGNAAIASVNDQSSSGDKTYSVFSDVVLVSTGEEIIFNGRGITLNANSGNNHITVADTAAGMPLVINANDGNDAIDIGQGNIDSDLAATVTVNGGAGTDVLSFDNSADATAESQVLAGLTFTDGLSIPFGTIETVHLATGPGGGTVALNNVATSTVIDGNGGDDMVNIGAGNLDANLLSSVTVNGAGGVDAINIDGSQESANESFTFNAGDVLRFGSTFTGKNIDANNVENESLRGGSGDDSFAINSVQLNLSIFGNGGNDAIGVLDSAGFVNVDTGTERSSIGGFQGDSLAVNSDAATALDAPASVRLLSRSDAIYDVSVSSNTSVGTLQVGAQSVLDVTHSLTSTGVIDMAGGAVAVRNAASQSSAFKALLMRGFAAGAWNGTGGGLGAINSSLANASSLSDAVGFSPSSSIFTSFPAAFAGLSVNNDDLLLRYTLAGDSDLNGVVNITDFARLAAKFNQTSQIWPSGDFNYDGAVNINDFALLAKNFNGTVAANAPRPAAVSIATLLLRRINNATGPVVESIADDTLA